MTASTIVTLGIAMMGFMVLVVTWVIADGKAYRDEIMAILTQRDKVHGQRLERLTRLEDALTLSLRQNAQLRQIVERRPGIRQATEATQKNFEELEKRFSA